MTRNGFLMRIATSFRGRDEAVVRTRTSLVACALTALALTSVAGAAPVVGVNCRKPLDLTTPGQDLSNCKLNGMTITGVVLLTYANLSGASLNGATLGGDGSFYAANVSGANMNGATIGGGYKPFQFANASGLNLRGATIGGLPNELAVFQSADMSGANLSGARIAGDRALSLTNLTGANLRGATVTGTEALLEAVYSSTICPDGTNSDNDGGTCIGHGVP